MNEKVKKADHKSQAATQEVGSEAGLNSAVINPYALAEVVAGQRIPWRELPDAPHALEQILGAPYEELFDPQYGGPLYLGLRREADGSIVRERSPLLDVKFPQVANDLVEGPSSELSDVRTIGELAARLNYESTFAISSRNAELRGRQRLAGNEPV